MLFLCSYDKINMVIDMQNSRKSSGFMIRRGVAYILDIFFVGIITMLVTQITIINPHKDEYAEVNSRYQEIISSTNNIQDVLKSDGINDILYDIARYGVVYTVLDAVIYVAYFVGFQRATGGQTLGKRILKIKVVNKDNNPAKCWQLLVRSLFLYQIIIDIAGAIAINYMAKADYMSFNTIISTVFQLITYTTVIFMAFRDDARGLHDLVAQTMVIDLKEVKEVEEKEEVKEAVFEEVKETKTVTKKKTVRKNTKSKSAK